jgi:hypothetical protein
MHFRTGLKGCRQDTLHPSSEKPDLDLRWLGHQQRELDMDASSALSCRQSRLSRRYNGAGAQSILLRADELIE